MNDIIKESQNSIMGAKIKKKASVEGSMRL
jgi:hypothetical protein